MPERFTFEARPAERARQFAGQCAASAFGIGLLAAVGWMSDARILAGQWGGYLPMAPSASLCFLLLGSAVFVAAHWPASGRGRVWSQAAAGLAAIFGVLVLARWLTGFDTGMEWRPSRADDPVGSIALSRMPPLTAGSIALEGVALLAWLHTARWRGAALLAVVFALLGTGVNVAVLVGYGYGVPLLYGGPVIPTSLPSGLALVLLGMGEARWAVRGVPALRAWMGDSTRGILLRAFLPGVLALILLAGWLNSATWTPKATRAMNPALWHSLEAMVACGVVGAVSAWAARHTGDLLDRARRSAEEKQGLLDATERMGNVGAWEIDIRTQKLVWTAEVYRLLELEPDYQPTLREGIQFYAPEARPVIEQAIQRAIEGGEPFDLELPVITARGDRAWVHVIGEADPARGRLFGFFQDISARRRAQEALRDSEQNYSELFENMLDGVAHCRMIYDDQGRPVDFLYVKVNPAFERLTGLRNVEGNLASKVIPGLRENHPELLEIYGRVASTGVPEIFEVDFKPLSKWLNISVYRHGQNGFAAVFDDITERKLNEVERETALAVLGLANSSENTRDLVRAITAELQARFGCEAVGIRLRDGEDYPYYETRGFPPEFVQAESLLCVRDARQEVVRDSKGNPVLECMCGNVLCGRFDPSKPFFTDGGTFWTNSTTRLLSATTEADRLSRTRNRCNGEGYESVALIPLRSSGETFGLMQLNDRRPDRFSPAKINQLEQLAASFTMALQQRMTQASLRESRSLLQAVMDGTTDAVYGKDEQGRYLMFNRAAERFSGKTAAEALGRDDTFLFPPDQAVVVMANDRRVIEERVTGTFEEVVTTADCRTTVFSSTKGPLFDASGRVVGLFGVSRDITARKRAEEEKEQLQLKLAQAQKIESIGRLAGGIAHDFNNLLTVINGYSALALRHSEPRDPQFQRLSEIYQAGERAAGLVRQLLAFSRRQELKPEILDLNTAICQMEKMLRRLVGEDIELVVKLEPAVAPVLADRSQVEQVIMNLAVNARDAMPGGGRLTLETAQHEHLGGTCTTCDQSIQPGRYVSLIVSDTGTGMDEETLKHLFEPFFTTKGVGQGTGLGLSTVQGIVVQSGGHIEVKSELGKGSAFRAILPAAEWPTQGASLATTAKAEGGNETILLVEDQDHVREYVATILNEYGYRTVQARNADEALTVLAGERVNLLITDVVMPGRSGVELARQALLALPGLKVLFMSGYSEPVLGRESVSVEGENFLQKPFQPEALAKKVREVLGPAKQKIRILIADDEAGVRAFLRAELEEGGYEVTEASDGSEALSKVREEPLELVIIDLVMPRQEGLETIQALRREAPGIGIIAISGAFGGQFLKPAKLLGADAILGKPVSAEVLLAKVADVLNR